MCASCRRLSGGAFGSGLRPQYQVVLAALAARALKRSVRLVLTRQQMYGLGYRPAMIQQLALGANADGTLDAITPRGDRGDVAIRGFPSQRDRLVRPALQVRATRNTGTSSCGSTCHAVRHARAGRGDRRLCARMRDGRTCGRAQARSARAAPALLFGPRPARGRALQQQEPARMLSPGRGGVRLGQAQPGAALDARRQRAGRLGHGDRRLGSAAGADAPCASC